MKLDGRRWLLALVSVASAIVTEIVTLRVVRGVRDRSSRRSTKPSAIRRWGGALLSQFGVLIQNEVQLVGLRASYAVDRAAATSKDRALVPTQRPAPRSVAEQVDPPAPTGG